MKTLRRLSLLALLALAACGGPSPTDCRSQMPIPIGSDMQPPQCPASIMLALGICKDASGAAICRNTNFCIVCSGPTFTDGCVPAGGDFYCVHDCSAC